MNSYKFTQEAALDAQQMERAGIFRKSNAPGLVTMFREREMKDQMMNEIDALRKDAERYRWLRDSPDSGEMLRLLYEDGLATPALCDEAIDAAMLKTPNV